MLAKIEGRNPAYSVKCRIGASMIWDAERRGILKPGKELIEPTSGNTGIALAFVGAARGYKVTLLMPETMSMERQKGSEGAGREADPDRGAQGMGASIERAEEMVAAEPDRYVLLQQFQNPANPEIHFNTTGPEIWERHRRQRGRAGGGHRNGRHHHRNFTLFQAGKEEAAYFDWRGAGRQPGDHADADAAKRRGPGRTGFRESARDSFPRTLDLKMVDRVELAGDEESIEMARRLAREEGILSRNFLRRGGRGGGSHREGAGDERKNHRGDSAGFGRALPDFGAFR